MPGRFLLLAVFSVSQAAHADFGHFHGSKRNLLSKNGRELRSVPMAGTIDIGKILRDAIKKSDARTDLFDRKFTTQEANACVESICGSARSNISAMPVDVLTSRKVESEQFKSHWSRISTSVAQTVNLQIERETLFSARMERALERGFRLEKGNQQNPAIYLAFQNVMGKLSPKVMTLLDFNPALFELVLKEDDFKTFVKDMPAHEQRLMRQTIDRVFIPVFMDMVMERAMGVDPFALRLRRLSDGRDANLVLIDDARKSLQTARRSTEFFGKIVTGSMLPPTQLALLERIAAGGALEAGEGSVYVSAARAMDVVGFVLQNETLADLRLFNVDPSAELAAHMADLRKKLATLPKLNTNAPKNSEDVCRRRLNMHLARNASGFALERTRKMVAEVRSAAKTVMATFVDPSQRDLISQRIDRVSVEIPTSHDQQLGTFEGKIGTMAGEIRHQIDLLKDDSAEADTGLLLDFMEAAEAGKEAVVNSRAQKLCEELPVGSASDAAMPPLGRIHLSWFAANFRDVGVGVFAHEFGHVMSFQLMTMNSANYYRSLSCTVNRNPYIVDALNIASPDDKKKVPTAEEDWADYFSSLILKELQRRGSQFSDSRAMACALVADEGDSYGPNTTKRTDGDTHSSGLMRLLMISSDRGLLTDACKPFTAYAAANGRALNCDLEGAK